jgi:hypothetical protein
MAQDFTALSTTELYAALLTHINDRDAALALGLDPATTTVTNPLTNSVRWNSANRYWEKFGGVSWAPLASSYAINITGTAPWAGITGKPATVTGYGITDGITTANIGAQHVTNSDQLGGQVPSYYQTALGFTPVQQGGGTGQGTNKVYVGWNAAGLYLQVDATNYAAVWPIGISGNAATATTAGTVTTAAQPNITSVGTLTSLAVSGVATLGAGATLGTPASGNLVNCTYSMPVGALVDFPVATPPAGYLARPLAAGAAASGIYPAQVSLISAYPALAAFLGTTWGGNGVTTFGIPWCIRGGVDVQASGNVGSTTHGENLAHSHSLVTHCITSNSDGTVILSSTNAATYNGAVIFASGGVDNLAAGNYVLKCIKY